MPWTIYIAHFFAGALLCNAVPHFVHGVSGEKFQSPFASPPGVGVSPPLTNMFWGFANGLAGAGLMLAWPPHGLPALGAVALGILAMGLIAASHFGKVKGNNK